MEGPNLNLKFPKLLMNANFLANIDKLILDFGTYPLNVVYNSFRERVSALNFDVDQCAPDLHFFFWKSN